MDSRDASVAVEVFDNWSSNPYVVDMLSYANMHPNDFRSTIIQAVKETLDDGGAG